MHDGRSFFEATGLPKRLIGQYAHRSKTYKKLAQRFGGRCCQPKKSMRCLILFLSFALSLVGCRRDKDDFVTGSVVEKGGCLADTYLVEIPGAAAGKMPFLCEPTIPLATLRNCENSVYIRLPASLAIPGKKIRFVYVNEEISCLSSSGAPKHIIVKSVRAD